MGSYFIKKFIDLIPTLLGVSLLAFLLIRLIPGDPVMLMIGERGASPEVYAELKANLGLDKPLYVQYFLFIKNAFMGNFGTSVITNKPVIDEFFARFPATVELGILAIFWACCFGIPLGIIAAVKRNTKIDYFIVGGSLVGYSMPIFWWALILIIIFSVTLGITPVSGRINVLYDFETITGFYLIDSWMSEDGVWAFLDTLKHLLLPSFALGTIPLAVITRMTRASMLDVLKEDFIRTARAKGLSPFSVVVKHALRNALMPIVTVIGLMLGTLVTGAILTETMFSWPGIGKWIVASVNARDYPVIQGGVLIIAFLISMINTFVDLTYYLINPKMRDSK